MRARFRRGLAVAAIFLLAGALPQEAHADSAISIGVPPLPRDFNVLTADHPGATIARRALVGTLRDNVAGGTSESMALSVANSARISPDSRRWEFRVSPLARFSNGRVVTAEDVRYSLQRCHHLGLLQGVKDISVQKGAVHPDDGAQWVVLTRSDASGPRSDRTLLLALGDCPILEKSSTEVFGSDVGLGSNIVSCGDFVISEIKLGREITLNRRNGLRARTEMAGPSVLTLRGFQEEEGALTALRAGTIDAFLSRDEGVIARAKKDETLFARECPIYTVVHRKGLGINCPDQLMISQIRYIG